MERLFWMLGCLFFLAMISCEKDEIAPLASDELERINSRAMDCRLCDNITDVSIVKIEEEDSKCCTFEVEIRSEVPCRHLVIFDGDTIHYIVDTVTELSFEVCNGETPVLEIHGYNEVDDEWNDVCFSQILDCSCDCDDRIYSLTELAPDEDGCCIYQVLASSSVPCNYSIEIENQIYSLNQVSVNQKIKVCPDEESAVTLYLNGEICSSDTLTCDCCNGVSLDFESLGILDGQCCNYRVMATNESNCTQYIFGPNGSVNETIPPGGSVDKIISICGPSGTLAHPYSIGTAVDEICDQIILSEVCVVDCCEDIVVSIDELGDYDSDDCCEYEVTVNNGSECEQFVFDENNNVVAAIPSGTTWQNELEVCASSGGADTYKIGPLANHECTTFTLDDVCKDCCDKALLYSTMISVDQEGCCTFRVTARNNGDCDLLLYTATETLATLQPGEQVSVDVKVCKKSLMVFLGTTLNQNEACRREFLLCPF